MATEDKSETVPSTAGHTRTSTTAGPDYCDECSWTAKDWVKWPCLDAAMDDVCGPDEVLDAIDSLADFTEPGSVEWRVLYGAAREIARLRKMLFGDESDDEAVPNGGSTPCP